MVVVLERTEEYQEAVKETTVQRLIRLANEAEAGSMVDITHLSDEEYLERLLSR